MRALAVAAVGLLALGLVVVGLDATAGFGRIGHGSLTIPSQPAGLSSAAGVCATADFESPCTTTYQFGPDGTLFVWFSVRNESRLDITLDGVPQRWIDGFGPTFLVRPIAQLDGGDPWTPAGTRDLYASRVPFRPVLLGPGRERIVGLELKVTADVAQACATSMEGTAMGWDRVPVAWHWVTGHHESYVGLARNVMVAAPVARDCGR